MKCPFILFTNLRFFFGCKIIFNAKKSMHIHFFHKLFIPIIITRFTLHMVFAVLDLRNTYWLFLFALPRLLRFRRFLHPSLLGLSRSHLKKNKKMMMLKPPLFWKIKRKPWKFLLLRKGLRNNAKRRPIECIYVCWKDFKDIFLS